MRYTETGDDTGEFYDHQMPSANINLKPKSKLEIFNAPNNSQFQFVSTQSINWGMKKAIIDSEGKTVPDKGIEIDPLSIKL
jgi:hypothetical protein